MKPTVLAICISTRKGHSKTSVERARLIADHGIAGDVHAGRWHRQLSLLALGDIVLLASRMRARGLPGLRHGSFAENFVIGGLDLGALGVGSRLRLGAEVQIVITQIGKECHTACAIMAKVGECIMPTRGLFATVERGVLLASRMAVGATVGVVEALARQPRPIAAEILSA